MKLSLRLLVPLLGLVALTGCFDSERAPEPADVASQGIPPAIKVTTSELRHVVYVTPGTGMLSAQERRSLADFLSDTAAGNADSVHLTLRATIAPRELAAVERTAIGAGVQPSKIEIEPVPPSDVGAGPGEGPHVAVEVVATVSRIDPPSCPRLSVVTIGGNDNPHSTNWGCSTVTDLEAMVADPRDLVQGESGGRTDAVLTDAAIERLRHDKVKALTTGQTFTPGGASSGGGGGGQ